MLGRRCDSEKAKCSELLFWAQRKRTSDSRESSNAVNVCQDMNTSKQQFLQLLNLAPKNNNNVKGMTSFVTESADKKEGVLPLCALINEKALGSGGASHSVSVKNGQSGNQSFILVPQQQLQQNVVLGRTVFQTSDGKKFVFMSGPNKQGIVAAKVGNNQSGKDPNEGNEVKGDYHNERKEEQEKQNSADDSKLEFPVVSLSTLANCNNAFIKEEDTSSDCNSDKKIMKGDGPKSQATPPVVHHINGNGTNARTPSPVEFKRKTRLRMPPNASTKKVVSLFRSDVPPPLPNTTESAVCTFHEHTLVRMATRGFWGGDRGPIQDVFRTIRTDVGDQTYSVEDITEVCYNLVKQKLDDAACKDDYYMYMKSYVDEFDGVMARVYPVTTIAMTLYLPMAEDYASTTWHGVPPTGWSEYRRAVIMREVFEVLYKFGLEFKTVPEFNRRYFDNPDSEEDLCPRPYVSCYDCSKVRLKQELDTAHVEKSDGKPAANASKMSTETKADVEVPSNCSVPNSPSVISAQFAESIVSACANSTPWPKCKASSSSTKSSTSQTPVDSVSSNTNADVNKALANDDDTLPGIDHSRYFTALWLGKAPREAEILFEDGTTSKISKYVEDFPLEKSSPPRGTKIIVEGKIYNARDVLGHFRRGVQLVEHNYNTVTNSNTTSTLKGTVNGGIVRKVPPYKISKLIHPGLHLETYTSRILSIADEESGLVKRSIRRGRCQFRRMRSSPSDGAPSTRQSAKRSVDSLSTDGSVSPPLKSVKTEPTLQHSESQTFNVELCDKGLQVNLSEMAVYPELPKSNTLIQQALFSAFMTSLPDVLSSRCSTDEPPLQMLIDSYKKTGEFLISLSRNLEQTLLNNQKPRQ